jgi:hypothetical protein
MSCSASQAAQSFLPMTQFMIQRFATFWFATNKAQDMLLPDTPKSRGKLESVLQLLDQEQQIL